MCKSTQTKNQHPRQIFTVDTAMILTVN